MKKFILWMLLLCCGNRLVYSESVQFVGEFCLYFFDDNGRATMRSSLSLYYDQVYLGFEVRSNKNMNITVDDDYSWLVKPGRDTSGGSKPALPGVADGVNALPGLSASPVRPPIPDTFHPVSDLPKVCRFEYIGYEDTGGQVSDLVCHYGNFNSVSFKRNETDSEIQGKVTIHYNVVYINEDGRFVELEGDRETRYARTFNFYYRQKSRIALKPGKIPQRLIVSLDTTWIEGTPASGGNNTYMYSWERWEDDEWKEVAGAHSRGYNAGGMTGDCRLRRKVVSGTQTAYTNACLIRNWDFGNRNYVLRSLFLWKGGSRPVDSAAYDITYYDGLGRPEQQVNIAASPLGSDWITPFYYDLCGKSDTRRYLPYTLAGNKGLYDPSAFVRQLACYNTFYPGEGPFAYSEKRYTAAVSDRLEEDRLAGKVFRDADRKFTYTYSGNAATEVWRIQTEADGGFRVTGYYPANTLYKVVAVDEDGKINETFTDLFGRIVLERNRNGEGDKSDVYPVYDDRGNRRVVVSPEGAALLTTGLKAERMHPIADLYSYLYTYDGYGRMTVKKLPGSAEEYWVYDRENRPVMSQDGHLRLQGRWKLIQYDPMGRVTEESLVVCTKGQAELQRSFDAGNTAGIYATARTVLRKCRYDVYRISDPVFKQLDDFVASVSQKPGATDSPDSVTEPETPGSGSGLWPFTAALAESSSEETASSAVDRWNPHPVGLQTWEQLAVLGEGDTVSGTIERVFYYDTEGRLIQTAEKNADSWDRFTASVYDFTGKPVRRFRYEQTSASQGSGLLTEYVYDSRDRLLLEKSCFNRSGTAQIAYRYDELGRLRERVYGKDICREKLSYNLQGWLTEMASPFFSMKLRYYSPALTGSRPLYTGRISEWEWRQGPDAVRAYSFAYDGFGRFSGARSFTGGVQQHAFTEQGITYDRNGNLRSLERTSGTGAVVDRLSCEYTGNRLSSLTENMPDAAGDVYLRGGQATGSYTYDVNGNLKTDSRRCLNYDYNFLNLLDKAAGKEGVKAVYTWVYPGEKRKVEDAGGKGYGYWGDFLYRLEGRSLNLKEACFAGGKFVPAAGGCAVYYYLSDHLGSVRAVLDSSGNVLERSDYYPFGSRHLRPDYPLLAGNRFRYNGKEEQTTGGLGFLDYGARMYDSGLGRWTAGDPLSETYWGISPYAYCANNPLSFTDPTGMWIDDYFLNSDGKIYFLNITDDPFDRLYASGENGKVNWDNYIDLEKGILDNEHFGTDAEGHDYAYYAFKNDESSDLFFYFAADHTEKEWGQVKYGTRSSYVAVTYDDGRDYGGADLLYHLLLENYTVRQHTHSHPVQRKREWFLPSGYAENDKVKDGDRSFAAWFYRYYPAKAVSMRWLLYDATVSRMLSYDLKGAWGYNKRTKEKKYFKY